MCQCLSAGGYTCICASSLNVRGFRILQLRFKITSRAVLANYVFIRRKIPKMTARTWLLATVVGRVAVRFDVVAVMVLLAFASSQGCTVTSRRSEWQIPYASSSCTSVQHTAVRDPEMKEYDRYLGITFHGATERNITVRKFAPSFKLYACKRNTTVYGVHPVCALRRAVSGNWATNASSTPRKKTESNWLW